MNDIERLRETIINLKNYLNDSSILKDMSLLQIMVSSLDETCLEPLSEYRITKAEMRRRTKESMDKLKNSGQVFTGPMFGWDNVGDGTVVPNWDEQDDIDYMRYLFLKDKKSAVYVAKKIAENGIRGKRGGEMSSSVVLRTIRNDYHLNRKKYPKPDWWGDSYYHDVAWT